MNDWLWEEERFEQGAYDGYSNVIKKRRNGMLEVTYPLWEEHSDDVEFEEEL